MNNLDPNENKKATFIRTRNSTEILKQEKFNDDVDNDSSMCRGRQLDEWISFKRKSPPNNCRDYKGNSKCKKTIKNDVEIDDILLELRNKLSPPKKKGKLSISRRVLGPDPPHQKRMNDVDKHNSLDDILAQLNDSVRQKSFINKSTVKNVEECALEKSAINGTHDKVKLDNYEESCNGPWSANYNRNEVVNVDRSRPDQVVLSLVEDFTKNEKKVFLEGFWTELKVCIGDTVNLLPSHSKDGNICSVNDHQNFLITNPDRLLSGTAVMGTLTCIRKSVLEYYFKGIESSNLAMLKGTIVHSLFQKAIVEDVVTEEKVGNFLLQIIKSREVLEQMLSLGLTEEALVEEVTQFVPQICDWICRNVTLSKHPKSKGLEQCKVVGVVDVEENIWSPRFGMKGKLDVTLEVKMATGEQRQVPLELKTGKMSQQSSHMGQVNIYSLINSDRRGTLSNGILVYLVDGKTLNVPASHNNLRGLVMMRNDLAFDLIQFLKKGKLPSPKDDIRFCTKCPQLLNCSILLQEEKHISLKSAHHAMKGLVPKSLSHLSPRYLQFFSHWVELLRMECQVQDDFAFWNKPLANRVKNGSCIAPLMLKSVTKLSSERFFHEFEMKCDSCCLSRWAEGAYVVLSETSVPLIAVAMGSLAKFTNSTVEFISDKNLGCIAGWKKKVFCIDKIETTSAMATNFSNLTRLMEDNSHCARLRTLIIDKTVPCFELTLSKSTVVELRSIMKRLNRPQKTAILKVLMSKDYVLVKGFPGTGKTSTIVALIRVLLLLKKTVLLSSYTHSAVDNVLLKLKEYEKDFLRVGNLDRIHSEIRPFSIQERSRSVKDVGKLRSILTSSPVVATTCLGASHLACRLRHFDVCIVDEASQVLQPACFGPLFYAEKFVLVGDPLQLSPVIKNDAARAMGMDVSLFLRLDELSATYELNVQYRMCDEIMSLSNRLVYGGALSCGTPEVASQRIKELDTSQIEEPWLCKTLSPQPVVFVDLSNALIATDSNVASAQNVTEAKVVVRVAEALTKMGITATSIGVIAPYQQQCRLLKSSLKSMAEIEVNTIDQYQGRDKDIIIISFVRMQSSTMNQGILNDLRRLNVALTRAKKKLIMVGCKQVLNNFPPLASLFELLDENTFVPMQI